MEDKVKKVARSGLGRGLAALISQPPVPVSNSSTTITPSEGSTAKEQIPNDDKTSAKLASIVALPKITATNIDSPVRFIATHFLINNPAQPRELFKESEIIELAASIKKLGVLQPIVCRPSATEQNKFEIVAGERRWRAAKLAGLIEVPVSIKELTDRETLEIGIVENVQRENLNPLELALAYQKLIDEFKLSQEEVAERIGKDRTTVSNIVRILKLPKDVQALVGEGKISLGHAKALLGVKDANAQNSLAKKVINEQLSVRALENLVARVTVLDVGKAKRPKTASVSKSEPNEELLERLRRTLGTKVSIRQSGERGTISIEFFSSEELTRLVEAICP